MDFIIRLLLNKHANVIYNYILIVVNRFTKMAYYLTIKKIIIVKELVELFFFKIVYYYNTLVGVVSNRDNLFISTF